MFDSRMNVGALESIRYIEMHFLLYSVTFVCFPIFWQRSTKFSDFYSSSSKVMQVSVRIFVKIVRYR